MEMSPEAFSSRVGNRLPPCGACGSQATGYHYGVNTCEACKEFFHRSLGRYKGYRCRNRETVGLCVYKPGKRKSCQFCRFQRCLRAGMSKGAIKIGRYSIVKKTRDENEMKRIHCDSFKVDDVKPDKTRLHYNPSPGTDTGSLQYAGPIDSFQANQHLNYGEDYDCTGTSPFDFDTGFSVKKEPNNKFDESGMEMSSRFPLSPQDSKSSPPILEDSMGVMRTESCMAKVSNSGIFTGQTSSPLRSFTPGEVSSILTPVSQSSSIEMDGLEAQPCSPTILNGVDCHGNIKSQTDQDYKFQHRTLTPRSDSSPCSCGSSELVLSPPDGERKLSPALQTNQDFSLGEGQVKDSSRLNQEIVCQRSECVFRDPSALKRKNCEMCSQMVTNCGILPSSVYHRGNRQSNYPDTMDTEDKYERLGMRPMPELTFAPPESCQSLAQGEIDQSESNRQSPQSNQEVCQESHPVVPGHFKLTAKRISLLPSQVPPLFANIDDVMRNLLSAHKENVADFTQVPKEEMIWHQMKHLELYDLKVSTFGHLPMVSGDEYDSIFKSTGIDVDCRNDLFYRYVNQMKLYSRAMVRFARCIPGFLSLERKHQVKMINWSRTEFVLLTIYPTHNLDYGVGIGLAGSWVCNQEMDGITKACFKGIGEFCDRLQKIDICREEMVLLKAMLIMTTDREEVIASPLANAIHWQLFQLLAEIATHRHEDPAMAIAGFMSILHETRRLGDWINSVRRRYRPESIALFDDPVGEKSLNL